MTTKRAMVVDKRDNKNGRFLPGNSGNGGRKPGARSKLGEKFLTDLAEAWSEHGRAALLTVAKNDSVAFVRTVASVLPREVVSAAFSLTATVDLSEMERAHGFFAAFKFAREQI